jgi:L-fuconolactonase
MQSDPAVADIIADWKAKKGTVSVRVIMRDNVSADPADPGVNRVLAAAAKHSMPVNRLCWGRLKQIPWGQAATSLLRPLVSNLRRIRTMT